MGQVLLFGEPRVVGICTGMDDESIGRDAGLRLHGLVGWVLGSLQLDSLCLTSRAAALHGIRGFMCSAFGVETNYVYVLIGIQVCRYGHVHSATGSQT